MKDEFISPDTTVSNIEAKQLEVSIKILVNTLPERCKEIFILSRFEHLSYKEISNLLGITVKTVENQIGNALKMLRKNIVILLLLIISFL